MTGSRPSHHSLPFNLMLLHTHQLTKNYGSLCALDRLDLTVKPGEIVGLLGPNGSGKSTALRLLLGFLKPTSGTASIAGHDCWHDSVKARQQVAYLPGELRLYENMTGRQLVRFLGQLRGDGSNGANSGKIDILAKRLDLDLDRPLAQLSSGMKRKAALFQVLVPRVPLLILDEPTNTLDPVMRDELLAQLDSARREGQAVLFSSHVLSEVERICDRVAILRQGRLVHMEEMAHLRQASRVQVRFAGACPEPPSMPGLQVLRREGELLTVEFRGELPRLLGWLAGQPVADLKVEPLGLSEIYHLYHGKAA
jgi:ABC-2 type transport system ATP-binding protein